MSLGYSKSWLHKWVERYDIKNSEWNQDHPKHPKNNPRRTSQEIEEIVKMSRRSLYKRGMFCGAQAIDWELEEQGVIPLPSLRTINRILSRNDLTNKRTGRYEPKGTPYPEFPAKLPNQRHQADFVGPRHIRGTDGAIRFYSLNTVDLATGRCAIHPLLSRSGNVVHEGFWASWIRLGMPQHLQVDNELVFRGSPKFPRGMGPLIRLCLSYGIELWFIPPSGPWRNGVVEKFNDHYQQKFLKKVQMQTEVDLRRESLSFENKHNNRYRYSKLNGKTPMQALAQMKTKQFRKPLDKPAPRTPLNKPESGRIHLILFIRSNRKLDVFGELFSLAPEFQYEYVVATIDVKEQRLKIFHDEAQVNEFEYKLR